MPRVKELLGGRSNLDLRNYIINGAFDNWQRGASFSLTALGYNTDRFLTAAAADGGTLATGTVTQQTLDPSFNFDQASYCRITNTSAGSSLGANSYYVFGQRIEDVRNFANKKVTVSIWASSSIASKQIGVYATQTFGTGGSAEVLATSSNNLITLTSTVTRYDITITFPSIAGKTIGTNNHVFIGFFLQGGATVAGQFGFPAIAWGGTGNTDIVRFQVTEGDVVGVPFSRAGSSVGGELSLCQRYYEKSYPANVAPGANRGTFGGIVAAEDPNAVLHCLTGVAFKAVKRTSPVIVIYGSDGVINNTNGWQDVSAVRTATSVGVSEYGISHVALLSSADRLQRYYFTADAEL